MFFTLFTLALLTATAISGVLAEFTINTPKVTQCKSAVVSWSKGVPPYHLVIVDANDPCGDPILDLGEINDNSYNGIMQLPANGRIEVYVEDSGKDDAWSGPITVQESNDLSCLPQSVRSHNNVTSASSALGSETNVAATPSTTPASHSPSSSVPTGLVPIGAANAGTNPLSSGASPMRQVSAPIASIAALAAVIFLVL